MGSPGVGFCLTHARPCAVKMLTELREKSQSFMIFVLFGMLIFIFIFMFGPQSQGLQAGGTRTVATGDAAKVRGQAVSMREVDMLIRRAANSGDLDEDKMAELRRDSALQLVDQVLLEQRARKMGLAISREEVLRYITSDRNPDFRLFTDHKGKFDEQLFSARITQWFGVTTDIYVKTKEREMLIDRYMAFLASQVKVSDAEVRAAFDEEKRTWNLEFIEFKGTDHKPATPLTPADGAAYAAANADEVKKYYDANLSQYVRGKEVRVRRILVRVPKDANDDTKKAARSKIDRLLAKAKAEGADFAAIASAESEGFFKKNGGDMSWKNSQNTSAEDYAVFEKLSKGEISDVQTSKFGLWFVKADDVKPAIDKKFADVKDEIGLMLAQKAAERDAAKKVAQVALNAAKGGKSLADAYYAAVPFKAPAVDAPAPDAPEDGEKNDAPAKPEGDKGPADAVEKVAAPERPDPVKVTGAFGARRSTFTRIPGIGDSPVLANALAGLTKDAPLVDALIEVDGRVIVARLKERVEPTDEDFAKEKDALAQRLRGRRAAQLFGNWQAIVFGPVTQREAFRKFAGGALLSSLPAPDGDAIKLSDAVKVKAKAPASAAPASKASKAP